MRSPLRARARVRVRVRPSLSLLRATTAPPAPTHAGPSTGSHPRRPLRRRPSLYLSLRARLPEQGGGDEGFAAPTPSAAATRPQLVAVPDRGGGGGEGGGGVSGSAMRGGGGRQPYAAPDGADAASIPAASRKMVQSLKGILDDRWEGEIYSTLCDCGMDPDIAIERLISQDTFHEVRRKRDKKKEDIGKLTLRNLRGM